MPWSVGGGLLAEHCRLPMIALPDTTLGPVPALTLTLPMTRLPPQPLIGSPIVRRWTPAASTAPVNALPHSVSSAAELAFTDPITVEDVTRSAAPPVTLTAPRIVAPRTQVTPDDAVMLPIRNPVIVFVHGGGT